MNPLTEIAAVTPKGKKKKETNKNPYTHGKKGIALF